MNYLNKRIFKAATLLLLITGLTSCKKYLEIGAPKTEINTGLVFNSNMAATDAILGIYGDMMNGSGSIWVRYSALLGQAADEMQTAEQAPQSYYYLNSLLPTAQNDDFWTLSYKYIYYANTALENMDISTDLTPAVKQQLRGEALFIRAYMHFNLINLFGAVPYITRSDYKVTSIQPRMPVNDVYAGVFADLKEAKQLLTNNFPDPNNLIPLPAAVERIRPNKGAAGALLARIYLYKEEWHNAELEADTLIKNETNYTLLTDINAVFLKNSRETIWALASSNVSNPNTFDAQKYVLTGAPSPFGKAVTLRPEFYNTAFEPGDKRKINWTGVYTSGVNTWYYPFKYKELATTGASKEYFMVLRLAEQYLIRAEARARQSNITGAVQDINALRTRARVTVDDLKDYPATLSSADCLKAIMQERRVELFAEGGHRWLDLKRTGQADAILAPLKGSNWSKEDQLFPIPDAQLNFDPAMQGHQNPGY